MKKLLISSKIQELSKKRINNSTEKAAVKNICTNILIC
jgi:hypothetical protein